MRAARPTSNLDVSVQAQILRLLTSLQKEFDLTYLFISHDMAVVYHMCDIIMVMYAGKVVERAETKSLYTNPLHPYTRALLDIAEAEGTDLKVTLAGEPPSLRSLPSGCRFHPRCPFKVDACDKVEPELVEMEPGQYVACHVFGPANGATAAEVTHGDT